MRDAGRAVVTGVSGFVGAALAGRLTRAGVPVLGLVRPGSAATRVAGMPGLRLVEWDGTAAALGGPLAEFRPTVVYHLASYGVQPGATDLAETVRGNVDLAVSVVTALADVPGCRLVHAGSCFEYGPAEPGRLLTEDTLPEPFSPYGAAKVAAGYLVRALAARLGVPAVVARLFTVYGPGEAADRLVPTLVRSLMAGEPADLTPGEQARDLVYVDDAVDGLLALGDPEGGAVPGQVYNVCTADPVTVRHVGDTLAGLLGAPPGLLRWGAKPYRPNEPMWIVGDDAKTRAATGWAPRTPLAAGLRATAAAAARPAATTA